MICKSENFQVKNLCRRTALIDENGGTLLQYFLSYLQSIFTFDLIRPSSPLDTADDVQSIGTFEILGRASYFIQTGDYENAIKYNYQQSQVRIFSFQFFTKIFG